MKRAVGFRNAGAICWLNSLIQSLLSSKQFVELLNKSENEKDEISNSLHLLKRIQMVYDSTSDSEMDISPILSAIMQDIRKKGNNMDLNGQQSASEGMTLLLDCINSKHIDELFTHKYEEQVITKETGKIVSTINAFNNQFMFFDEETLLRENIEEFIKYHETPLKDYKADNDLENNFTFKRAYILRYIPKIIVILLNRYHTNGRTQQPRNPLIKLKNEFSIKNKNTQKMMVFKKIAEIDQQGMLDGGHYYCRVLRGRDVFTINDTQVNYDVFGTNPNTYMTFYERLD